MQRRFDGYTALCPNLDHYLASVDRILIFFTPDAPTLYKSHAESLCAHLKWHRHWTTGSFFLLISSDEMHLFREFCCLEIKDTTDTPRSASYIDSSRNWQQGKTFYEAVWQTRWLHISHREFPFSLWQHSCSNGIWSLYITTCPLLQSLWCVSWFSRQSPVANWQTHETRLCC